MIPIDSKDVAKTNSQLHGIDNKVKLALRKKLTRNKLIEFIAQLPKCMIAMEACGGGNFLARKFTNLLKFTTCEID